MVWFMTWADEAEDSGQMSSLLPDSGALRLWVTQVWRGVISRRNKPMLFQTLFWPHPLIYSYRNLSKSFQYNNTNPSVCSCWVASLSSLVKSAINKFLWDYPTRRNQLDLSSKLHWTFGASTVRVSNVNCYTCLCHIFGRVLGVLHLRVTGKCFFFATLGCHTLPYSKSNKSNSLAIFTFSFSWWPAFLWIKRTHMNTPSPSLCKGPVVIQLLENQKILKADEEPWYD